MEIKTTKELRKKAIKILDYMDKCYGDDVVYGRITLAEILIKRIIESDRTLEEKTKLTQSLIYTTAATDVTEDKKFKL